MEKDIKIEQIDVGSTVNTKIFATQGAVSFGGNAIELLLRYLYGLLLARTLGAGLLGIYFLGFTVFSFLLLIAKLGLQEGILKFVSSFNSLQNREKIKGAVFSATGVVVISSLLICVVAVILAPFVSAKVFRQPTLSKVIIGFLISLPFVSILEIFLSYFQANLKMRYYALVQSITQPLINIVTFLFVSLLGYKLFGAIFSYFLSIVLALLLAVYLSKKRFGLFDRSIQPTPHIKELLGFSLPLVPAAILDFSTQWIGTLMLGHFRNVGEVGIYSVILRTANLCTVLFLVPSAYAFAPMVANLYVRKDISSLKALYKLVTKWIMMLTLPVAFLFIFLSKDILALFGSEFIIGKNALIILCLGQIFALSIGPAYYVVLISGRSKIILVNSMFIYLLNIILNVGLIAKYGFLGAAVAHAVSLAVFGIITLGEIYYLFKMHPYNLKFLKPLIAVCLAAILFYFLRIYFKETLLYPISATALVVLLPVCYGLILRLLRFDSDDKLVFATLKARISPFWQK